MVGGFLTLFPFIWMFLSTFKTEAEIFSVPPTLLPGAFEPFGELHASPVKGVRAPGQDLPACHQLLAVYHGEMDLRNEDEGTVVHVAFPLR